MTTKVVNFRKEPCDVKICRLPNGSIPDPPNAGCFGNPFVLHNTADDVEREKVIDEYRKYFLIRVETDPAFREAVLSLKDKTLGCFCAPLKCHGHVIAAWLDAH